MYLYQNWLSMKLRILFCFSDLKKLKLKHRKNMPLCLRHTLCFYFLSLVRTWTQTFNQHGLQKTSSKHSCLLKNCKFPENKKDSFYKSSNKFKILIYNFLEITLNYVHNKIYTALNWILYIYYLQKPLRLALAQLHEILNTFI